MWSVILMPMSVWLRLPSVSISRGYGVTVAAGAAFRQDWPQAGADYRGANIYPCLRCDNVHNVYDTVSYRACNSGHQYLFYCYRWLCHGAGGVRTDKRDQVDGDYHLHRTDCADYWPAFRRSSDALYALESPFAIIAVMGFISFVGLLLAMPETVKRGAVPFSAKSVLRDFRNVFCNRLFLFGAATISLSYIPMMSWVAVSPVILIDAGGLTTSQFAWTQVPVFGAVIVANAIVARFVKDPTEPRFIWRAVPIQLVGLALLIIGNLLSPHVWLWSVLGTSLYAFGIGLIFPTLFRFTLFSNNLPKGTVSASLNMVILMVMSVSVEIGRWLWFNGGRLPFHLLAVVAGVIVVFTLAGLLNRVRQHQAAELAEER